MSLIISKKHKNYRNIKVETSEKESHSPLQKDLLIQVGLTATLKYGHSLTSLRLFSHAARTFYFIKKFSLPFFC